ncbi:hypothetical protein A9K55_008276 [Cordyceps militaris]|uniref:Cysteine-rich transmembrane CYSTM domain-containing protein n=1 Tax=Cordyceps militaris TaxID=73501 RepID=A0A2H4SH40_CORMI|nr:hypothetical protein A9K55_008276 [Cordyceps militaris]
MSNQDYYNNNAGGQYPQHPQASYGPPQGQVRSPQGGMQYQQAPPPPQETRGNRGGGSNCLMACLAALCCCCVVEESCECCLECCECLC